MYPGQKESNQKTERKRKEKSKNHVELELQATTTTVNDKLLPGSASISLIDSSSMNKESQMSFESIRLWFRLFLVNDLATILVLFLWILINIALFIGQFFTYHQSQSYFYLRALISDGLSVARASALCLNFNCFLILLPVCRNLLSLIRYVLPKCDKQSRFRRYTIRLFDQHIGFHRCVGYAICFWSLIHVGAHVYNYERLMAIRNEYLSLPSALNLLFLVSPDSEVNPLYNGDSYSLSVVAMLGTTPGITGVILLLCLLVIFGSSTALIRRSFYEIFWFAHHLFVVFFICMIIHGLQGLVRSQTNLDAHNPGVCASLYRQWGLNQQCLVYPRFQGSTATSWMWLCTPLALYALERVLRFIRSLQKVEIVDVIRHESNVIELRFRSKSMSTPQPGQYIYLKCFSVSKFEWHPFTVTSAAEEAFVSVHIRTVGNWTKELAHKFRMYPQDIPRIGVDGPYGSPADDVFNYDGVVLVGAGIGVTPYAAILKHIRSCQSNQVRLRRVYFYWMCNTTSCYEWFAEMLQQLEQELRDRGNLLTYHIYLTQWSIGQARAVIQNNSAERDLWTGLESKTYYGRPNFEVDFQSIINEDWGMTEKRHIGVFVCGPQPLVKQLQRLCIKINDHSSTKNNIPVARQAIMNNSSVNADDGIIISKLSTFERYFKFYFLLIMHIPSLCSTIFILFHFKWNHLVNQILGLLVIVNGLIIIAELPFTLTYLYHGFVRDLSVCSDWVLVNYTLFMLSISLTAWTSIERYLFIYHEHFIKKHSILLHYFPVGIHFIYTPLFYVGLVIFYPCQQTYSPYSYICGGPCYLFQIIPCMIDWGFNVGFVLLITCVVNIILIISNIQQRDRMKKAIITARKSQEWRRIMKLSIQLFSISTLCIIGWIPYGVVSIMQIFADTPLLDYILATFFIYFPYVQTLFLPYACLFFVPEIKKKFYSVFASFWCFKLFCPNNRIHSQTVVPIHTLTSYRTSAKPHN